MVFGTEIADPGFGRMQTDADLDLRQFHRLVGAPAFVELFQRLQHGERCARRLARVIEHVNRGIPHGGEAVAHIFVDEAFVIDDDAGHWCEILVEQGRHLRRRQLLRDRRKAANVGKEGGDLARLPFELQQRRIAFEAVEDQRRQELAECAANELPRDLFLLEHDDEGGHESRCQDEAGRHRINQQARGAERVISRAEQPRRQHEPDAETGRRRHPRQQDKQQQRRQRREGDLDRPHDVPCAEQGFAGKRLFNDFRVDMNPGPFVAKRSDQHVAQALRRCADHHDPALDCIGDRSRVAFENIDD